MKKEEMLMEIFEIILSNQGDFTWKETRTEYDFLKSFKNSEDGE